MARLVGINHVALEVGDLDAALELYGRLFSFELRGRVPGMAFIDMGDQFLAVAKAAASPPTTGATSASWSTKSRRCGRRPSARESTRSLRGARASTSATRGATASRLWTTARCSSNGPPGVQRKLGVEGVEKTAEARAEIEERGLAD